MKIIDIRSKFATIPEYLRALVTNSERSQVILHLLTNIDQFRKRKHSQAIGNVGKAFGSIFNVRKAFARRL